MNELLTALPFDSDEPTTQPEPKVWIHPWQDLGLGAAPFRFLYEEDRGRAHTYCDACGTEIRYVQHIADSKGHTFKVGNECVRKTNDSRLIAASDAARRERERKQRIERAAEKQRQRAEAAAQELQRQRDANGGLTDYELKQQQEKERQEREREQWSEANSEVIAYLDSQLDRQAMARFRDCQSFGIETTLERCREVAESGGFAADMRKALQTGPFQRLSSRQATIIAEIAGKQAGRTGSKAYNAVYDRVLALYERGEEATMR